MPSRKVHSESSECGEHGENPKFPICRDLRLLQPPGDNAVNAWAAIIFACGKCFQVFRPSTNTGTIFHRPATKDISQQYFQNGLGHY